jgi:O-methyltransferase involved in polyketide biosynthesis
MSASSGPSDCSRFDPTTPNIARMYDYFLGGKDNFAVDRQAGDQVTELAPEVPLIARENRRFLDRVVRFLVDAGIRQFIDIGTGLPTQGHVHEILQRIAPDARVAYIDNDPVVVTHGQALLSGRGQTTVINADLRNPHEILTSPALAQLIDLRRPVAILLMAVLHFIDDDDQARHVIVQLTEAITPGSYLALSHAVSDTRPDTMAQLASVYREGPMKGAKAQDLRTRSEVVQLLDGLDIIEPGIVHLPAWRPDPGATFNDPEAVWLVGGIGRKGLHAPRGTLAGG